MDARRQRSRGLDQINRLTGWLAGGALVASAAFVALLARPSTSPASTPPSSRSGPADTGVTAPPVSSATTVDPNVAGSVDGNGDGTSGSVAPAPLNPPVQAPRQSSRQAQATTGAS